MIFHFCSCYVSTVLFLSFYLYLIYSFFYKLSFFFVSYAYALCKVLWIDFVYEMCYINKLALAHLQTHLLHELADDVSQLSGHSFSITGTLLRLAGGSCVPLLKVALEGCVFFFTKVLWKQLHTDRQIMTVTDDLLILKYFRFSSSQSLFSP